MASRHGSAPQRHDPDPLRKGTDLEGGWAAGVAALATVKGSGVKRVFLLSDGQANAGETNSAVIAERCRAATARGISTTTCGLGKGFNEALMVAMGDAGRGSSYYGDSAEDLMEPSSANWTCSISCGCVHQR